MQTPTTPVSVVLVTYRRPDELAVTVSELLQEAARAGAAASLVVVDNDPEASAREVVRRHAAAGVRYVHEPAPGIAAARNRALAEVTDGLLIFIDDDEHPREGWLCAMLDTHAATGAAGIAGPVLSEFEVEPDRWIKAGRFFNRRRMPTGTPITVAGTGNLLLDLDQVGPTGIRFDDRLGLAGGSDTLFTRQLIQAGLRLVWCDEAIVVDRVPASRLTRQWVLRRAFRYGNSWAKVAVYLCTTRPERIVTRLRLAGQGLARMVAGAARIGLGVVTGSIGHRARGRRTWVRGAGFLAGSLNIVYHEYRRPMARR